MVKETTIIALVVTFIGFLFMAISSGSVYWLINSQSAYGLWTMCARTIDLCQDLEADDFWKFIRTVRAFTLLGILTLVAGFVLVILNNFISALKPRIPAIVLGVAAFFQMIGNYAIFLLHC